jgi:hypothetical protein
VASKKKNQPSRMQRNKTPARKRSASQVIASSRESLSHAELGLSDFRGNDPQRQMAGLRNLIMHGRTVTFPLEVLAEDGEERDEHGHGGWYRTHVAQRMQDPIPKFFVQLRNLLEKEGILDVSKKQGPTSVHIDYLNTADLYRSAPPGTTQITVGIDGVVRFHRADGRTVETAWPGIRATTASEFAFEDTPPELANRTVDDLAGAYLQMLGEILAGADAKFGQSPLNMTSKVT